MKLIVRSIFCLIFALAALTALPNNARAENKQINFHDWTFFKTERTDRAVCYIVSLPIKKSHMWLRKGEPYFMVTNVMNDADEITASSGYIYKATSDTEISFGSQKFYLFPHMVIAWANDINEDLDIIKEMQKNDEFTVSGTMRDNKVTHDTYSLIGFRKAYERLKAEECK